LRTMVAGGTYAPQPERENRPLVPWGTGRPARIKGKERRKWWGRASRLNGGSTILCKRDEEKGGIRQEKKRPRRWQKKKKPGRRRRGGFCWDVAILTAVHQ